MAEKTKSSAVVFNTPAVWLCHGFKLAEYLALGKAIISTFISRELPSPLVHGRHVHYIDGSPISFREAIELILSDQGYRINLERNAYDYYTPFFNTRASYPKIVDLPKGCVRSVIS